jgi:hypothetical protein
MTEVMDRKIKRVIKDKIPSRFIRAGSFDFLYYRIERRYFIYSKNRITRLKQAAEEKDDQCIGLISRIIALLPSLLAR